MTDEKQERELTEERVREVVREEIEAWWRNYCASVTSEPLTFRGVGNPHPNRLVENQNSGDSG